jgi:hypothetical protein
LCHGLLVLFFVDAHLCLDLQKKPNKRVSFMRAVRRKSTGKASPPLPQSRQITHPHHSGTGSTPVQSIPYSSTASRSSPAHRRIDESVFAPGPGLTKIMSLSNLNLAAENGYGNTASMYAPSIVSTTGAGHGHTNESIMEVDEVDEASTRWVASADSGFVGNGVGGTLSSQCHNSAFDGDRAPVGYVKPAQQRGFLARISSRKIRTDHLAPVPPLPQTSAGLDSDASLTYGAEPPTSTNNAYTNGYVSLVVCFEFQLVLNCLLILFAAPPRARHRPACRISIHLRPRSPPKSQPRLRLHDGRRRHHDAQYRLGHQHEPRWE